MNPKSTVWAERPRSAADLFHLTVATWFGCGLSPVAPGTVGTAGALPLYLLLGGDLTTQGLAAALLFALGTWSATAVGMRFFRATDAGPIVVDEVVGLLVTTLGVPFTPLHALLGFGLFRLFDIWKPWPVRWADREVHSGFGTMLDDLLAALYARAVLELVLRLL